MAGTIEIHLVDPGFLAFKSKVRCRVLIDGADTGAMRIGDTARFQVPEGEREVRIVLVFWWLIRRRSKPLRVFVPANATVKLIAEYSRLWGKYALSTTS
jgi:hypothetical protein